MPGRRQCIGVILRLSPSSHTPSSCCFSHGLYRKERKEGRKLFSPKTPCSVPLQTGVPWHSHYATQSWVVELLCSHVPFQTLRKSASSPSYCQRSGCHNCLRANSPVCLQTPSPSTQVPCWPVTWEGDSCVPSWIQDTACSFLGRPLPQSHQCQVLQGGAGVSHSHHCPGPYSASLLHCCFPQVVQIGNKRQLDMAGTTT